MQNFSIFLKNIINFKNLRKMIEVLRTKYDVIYVDEANRIVKNEWSTDTIDMNWEEFKTELLTLKEIVVNNNTYGILGDTSGLRYGILPEQQDWIAQNYFPEVIAAGLKKYGIIVSTDLVTELSVEQTIDENQNAPFATQYFDNQEDAYQWLLK